jgi:hypothetical protein
MRVWLGCMTALLVPLAAAATDLNSGVRSELHWTDNVYSTSINELDDFSGRVAPWAEVTDPDGNVTWGVRYGPAYEYYLDENGLRGFDHDAEGRLAWRVGPRTTLRIADRFQRYHSVSRFNEQADPGQDVVAAGERARYKTNLATGSLEHLLSPLDLVALSVSYNIQDFSEEQVDREFLGTGLVYQHFLNERTTLGARASWSRQTLIEDELDDRSTDYFNLSAVFTREISRGLHLEVSAGPAYIVSDVEDISLPPSAPRRAIPFVQEDGTGRLLNADSCPRNNAGERILSSECGFLSPALTQQQLVTLLVTPNIPIPITGTVPSADDSQTTYFADISLVKDWERLRGEISYQRRESQSSGFGAFSDIFYGALRWQVSRRLSAKWITSYEMREQATDALVLVTTVANEPTPPFLAATHPLAAQTQAVHPDLLSQNVGLDLFVTNVGLIYQLTRRSAVYTNVYWRDEQSSGDVSFPRDMQRLGISVGIHYVFDPIEL